MNKFTESILCFCLPAITVTLLIIMCLTIAHADTPEIIDYEISMPNLQLIPDDTYCYQINGKYQCVHSKKSITFPKYRCSQETREMNKSCDSNGNCSAWLQPTGDTICSPMEDSK